MNTISDLFIKKKLNSNLYCFQVPSLYMIDIMHLIDHMDPMNFFFISDMSYGSDGFFKRDRFDLNRFKYLCRFG
jgi:hypothetical protein